MQNKREKSEGSERIKRTLSLKSVLIKRESNINNKKKDNVMSGVRWRVSLLFVLITLSIFFSLLANSDRFMEVRGNETYTQTGAGVSSENPNRKSHK